MKKKSPGRRFAQPSIIWIALSLALAGAIGFGTYRLLPGDAKASTAVPHITLDTLQGKYVVGDPPGRVAVLFFSFPG